MIMENSKKFVAFLDILGFKQLVQNNKHAYLIDTFKKFLFMNQYGLANGQVNQNTADQEELFNTGISNVHLISISDSIILFTNDNSIDNFINIVNTTSTLLNIGIKEGLPLRGGISCGNFLAVSRKFTNQKFVFSKQLMLGKALVEAYELESQQEWSGCIIQQSCIEQFSNIAEKAKLNFIIEHHKIIKYDVPLKKEKAKYYVVNWIKNNHSIDNKNISSAFSKHNKNINSSSVECKIKHTIDFFEYIMKNKYFSESQAILEVK